MTAPIRCPECHTLLASDAAVRGPLRCAACGSCFDASRARSRRSVSWKAAASLTLGVLSLGGVFLTGVPALLLGAMALNEIDRRPGTLRGRRLAAAGVVAGLLLSLALPVIVLTLLTYQVSNLIAFREKPRLEPTALGSDELPGGLTLVHSHQSPGVMDFHRYARYENAYLPTMLMSVVRFPPETDSSLVQEFGKRWDRPDRANVGAPDDLGFVRSLEVRASRRFTVSVDGQPREVTEETLSNPQGNTHYRRYYGAIPDRTGVTLLVVTLRANAGETSFPLTETEVRRFWESFRPAETVENESRD